MKVLIQMDKFRLTTQKKSFRRDFTAEMRSYIESARRSFFFRKWRDYRDLTQGQLAAAAALSGPSSISQIESGKQGWNDSTLILIARALHCLPGELLMRDPFETEPLMSIWALIPPERREQALAVLRTFAVSGSQTAEPRTGTYTA